MGFGELDVMRDGLRAVADLPCAAIGTITLDSYTRVGDYESPVRCLQQGMSVNGFPILSHALADVRQMLSGIHGEHFPVQVRHGTAEPQQIFRRLLALGLDATEGGPVSYCMPYSRIPLARAVSSWRESCLLFAGECPHAHIETFGGCLLGQLCPPSLLICLAVLEALFFRQHGVQGVSLSYAQGTCMAQDLGALASLRQLATEYLAGGHWHVVVYGYMGVFPRTERGAHNLIADSARLAYQAGCERLIVKTLAEARQIPSVADNLAALSLSARVCIEGAPAEAARMACYQQETLFEARCLIEGVLNLSSDIGTALVRAFACGLLDIPYCLHADNRGQTRVRIDSEGAMRWQQLGKLPLPASCAPADQTCQTGANELMRMLNFTMNRYDQSLH